MTVAAEKRWLALYVLCFGVLMIVLDTTIVTVALPSIRADLGFDETSLVWVVNAYMLTFGGFLLLGGRLGDLFGHRKLFLIGLTAFTLASLACGLASSQEVLIAARAAQGLGGAVVTAVALSLIMDLFAEPQDRAKAMGIYSFVCAAGGTIGALLGGFLTTALSWHWIFLVNLPIGTFVYASCLRLLPVDTAPQEKVRLDVAGAVTITVALVLAVYAIVNGNQVGWRTLETMGLLGTAAALFAVFIAIEMRADAPLVPLRLFRLRNLATANIVGVLWAAAMFAWFVIAALYMQLLLDYTPLQIGLAFVPADLIMAVFSLGLSARIVMRFGIRGPIAVGMLLVGIGLFLFACAPLEADFLRDILPGMLLLGLGAGMALNPVLLAAMNDVSPGESGLASGIVNTSFMMGGALGLAVFASLAAARTDNMLAVGVDESAALSGGYDVAFGVGAAFAVTAAVVSVVMLRARPVATADQEGPSVKALDQI